MRKLDHWRTLSTLITARLGKLDLDHTSNRRRLFSGRSNLLFGLVTHTGIGAEHGSLSSPRPNARRHSEIGHRRRNDDGTHFQTHRPCADLFTLNFPLLEGEVRSSYAYDSWKEKSKFTHFITRFLNSRIYHLYLVVFTRRRSGLKIRIEQSSGGSSPPPGTIFETCYVVQSIRLNAYGDSLHLRGRRCIHLNLGTNSGTLPILFSFNAKRLIHPCGRHGRYMKFISFTLDYGMHCGLLVRSQISTSATRLAIRQLFDKFLNMALQRIARRGVVDAGGWYIVPLFDLGLSRGLCIRGQSSSNHDHTLRCGYVGRPDR
jgi:hypothetical protein